MHCAEINQVKLLRWSLIVIRQNKTMIAIYLFSNTVGILLALQNAATNCATNHVSFITKQKNRMFALFNNKRIALYIELWPWHSSAHARGTTGGTYHATTHVFMLHVACFLSSYSSTFHVYITRHDHTRPQLCRATRSKLASFLANLSSTR